MTDETENFMARIPNVGDIIFDVETETAVIIDKSEFNPFVRVRTPLKVEKMRGTEYILCR